LISTHRGNHIKESIQVIQNIIQPHIMNSVHDIFFKFLKVP